MSYRTCAKCGKTFRARSHASRESKCWDCEPRVKNTRMQQIKRDDNMTKDAYSRLEKLEKEIKDLRMEYDILQGEANRLVSDIQTVAFGLLEKAVEEAEADHKATVIGRDDNIVKVKFGREQ